VIDLPSNYAVAAPKHPFVAPGTLFAELAYEIARLSEAAAQGRMQVSMAKQTSYGRSRADDA
jgi:hypothetical protein